MNAERLATRHAWREKCRTAGSVSRFRCHNTDFARSCAGILGVFLFLGIFLPAGFVHATALRAGTWYGDIWQTIEGPGYSVRFNIAGGAGFVVDGRPFMDIPFVYFIFRGIPNGHSPMRGRTDQMTGGWEEIRGEAVTTNGSPGATGGVTSIKVKGVFEGVMLITTVTAQGNTIQVVYQGLGLLPSRDITGLDFGAIITRASTNEFMPFTAETYDGKRHSGVFGKLFPAMPCIKWFEVTRGSTMLRFEFPPSPAIQLANYGNPDGQNAVGSFGERSAVHALRSIGGRFESSFTVKVVPQPAAKTGK